MASDPTIPITSCIISRIRTNPGNAANGRRKNLTYYEKIADALAPADKIAVVGHGAGKSNAAHHLTEFLQAHHRETYQRIVRDSVADLSSITTPQLLELARQALHE